VANPVKTEITIFFLIFCIYLVGCGPLDLEKGVKVDVKSEKSLPVQVQPQQAEGLPVSLNVSYDRPFPVSVEVPKLPVVALVLAAFLTTLSLIVAVIACVIAVKALKKTFENKQSLQVPKVKND
jgi:hypothetical protein